MRPTHLDVRIAALAREALGEEPAVIEQRFDPLASPAWRGVESEIWFATHGQHNVAIKHVRSEVSFYVDFEDVAAITSIIGDQGAGPAVSAIWPADRLIAMVDPGWRVGGLQDAADEAVRQNVIAAKKRVHDGQVFARTSSIFHELPALASKARDAGANLPNHLDVWLSDAETIEEAINAAGVDLRPCHRDGNTSNLLVGPNDEVLLIDFDLAANADPFEDVGCYLVEFFDTEPESREGFIEWHGSWDEGLYERAMLYGLLDDLRCGLIAATLQATDPTSSQEYSKYAEWRFLRHEAAHRRSTTGDRLRRMR